MLALAGIGSGNLRLARRASRCDDADGCQRKDCEAKKA